jgi:hypothetical protein
VLVNPLIGFRCSALWDLSSTRIAFHLSFALYCKKAVLSAAPMVEKLARESPKFSD